MQRKTSPKAVASLRRGQPTVQSLAVRIEALERDVAMLYLTGQLRQAFRRIAALEAK